MRRDNKQLVMPNTQKLAIKGSVSEDTRADQQSTS